MDQIASRRTSVAVPCSKTRRGYTPPSLIEYGSVAKLTQSGGSTQS